MAQEALGHASIVEFPSILPHLYRFLEALCKALNEELPGGVVMLETRELESEFIHERTEMEWAHMALDDGENHVFAGVT